MTDSSKTRRKSPPPSPNKEYYPVFLDVAGKRCVVVGGGRVAERKCLSLIKAGAEVTVISPEITRRLEGYREKGLIRHIGRRYRKGDLRSAFCAIVATDVDETNRKAVADAGIHKVLLNVVDNPSLCAFIVPSVLRRGLLSIAVSTSGASPAMARAIRKELEGRYRDDFSKYLRFLKGIRVRAMADIPDKGMRERILKALASAEMVEMLIRKGFRAARRAALERWRKFSLPFHEL